MAKPNDAMAATSKTGQGVRGVTPSFGRLDSAGSGAKPPGPWILGADNEPAPGSRVGLVPPGVGVAVLTVPVGVASALFSGANRVCGAVPPLGLLAVSGAGGCEPGMIENC